MKACLNKHSIVFWYQIFNGWEIKSAFRIWLNTLFILQSKQRPRIRLPITPFTLFQSLFVFKYCYWKLVFFCHKSSLLFKTFMQSTLNKQAFFYFFFDGVILYSNNTHGHAKRNCCSNIFYVTLTLNIPLGYLYYIN